MSTDADWEKIGRNNPFFGVASEARFLGRVLEPEAAGAFRTYGEVEVARILEAVERWAGPCPRTKALDFGCGVGRLSLPLARHFQEVVGVDISRPMLEEARRQAGAASVGNLRLCRTLEEVAGERGTFGFVNTFVVLQHIAPERGLACIREMIELLAEGGCGALHMKYGHRKHGPTLGAKPLGNRLVEALRRPFSRLQRHLARRDPAMQMNAYPVNQALFLLHQAGVQDVHAVFTDHGGHLGFTLYFRR